MIWTRHFCLVHPLSHNWIKANLQSPTKVSKLNISSKRIKALTRGTKIVIACRQSQLPQIPNWMKFMNMNHLWMKKSWYLIWPFHSLIMARHLPTWELGDWHNVWVLLPTSFAQILTDLPSACVCGFCAFYDFTIWRGPKKSKRKIMSNMEKSLPYFLREATLGCQSS